MDTNRTQNNKWRLAIDHSARFYPIISTKKKQSIFCLTAQMDDVVDKSLLEDAVNDVMIRFPAYRVRLCKGYSWHHFKQNEQRVIVFDINENMLEPIDKKQTNGFMFRLSCGEHIIKLDMFHALTDANGAMAFLKTIIYRYKQLLGVQIATPAEIDWQQTPDDGEMEDSFEKHYSPIKLSQLNLKSLAGGKPHRIRGSLLKDGYQKAIALANAGQIVDKAHEYDASFTAYTTGLLAYAIKKISHSKHPIVIMIPVNLRKIYSSNTMRNFVIFVRIVIQQDKCDTIEDCVEQVKEQLAQETKRENLEAFVSTTVRAQKNVILRMLPLFLKTAVIRFGRLFMRSRQTIIYSNLGTVKVDEKLGIDHFAFNPNVSKNNTQNLGSCTLNGKTCFAFTKAIGESDLHDAFFNLLSEQGIALEIVK